MEHKPHSLLGGLGAFNVFQPWIPIQWSPSFRSLLTPLTPLLPTPPHPRERHLCFFLKPRCKCFGSCSEFFRISSPLCERWESMHVVFLECYFNVEQSQMYMCWYVRTVEDAWPEHLASSRANVVIYVLNISAPAPPRTRLYPILLLLRWFWLLLLFFLLWRYFINSSSDCRMSL